MKIICVLIIVSFIACNTSSKTNDPKIILEEFFARLDIGDSTGAAKLATPASRQNILRVTERMSEERSVGSVGITPLETKQSGDTIWVTFYDNTHSGKKVPGELPLTMHEGKWKVNFDTATIYSIARKRGFIN
ncbi:MAG TPA: hypothetical protein VHM26_01440 [Chitinophagaceae bacterium]|jgi:hypothetical protein|nr:hypothetical protein [Chitinophagaceae bacterium]